MEDIIWARLYFRTIIVSSLLKPIIFADDTNLFIRKKY